MKIIEPRYAPKVIETSSDILNKLLFLNFSSTEFMKYNYGSKIAKSVSYGYTSGLTKVRGTCKITPFIPLNYTSVFQFNLNGNSAALKQTISNYGPVAIAMYVSNVGLFQNYKSGIFSDPYCPGPGLCGTVNHGMFN